MKEQLRDYSLNKPSLICRSHILANATGSLVTVDVTVAVVVSAAVDVAFVAAVVVMLLCYCCSPSPRTIAVTSVPLLPAPGNSAFSLIGNKRLSVFELRRLSGLHSSGIRAALSWSLRATQRRRSLGFHGPPNIKYR
jgi:hypothetical protein